MCKMNKFIQYLPLTAKNDSVVAGSGAKSKRYFLFGSFEAQIKFVPGDSAGLVTAFYVWFNAQKIPDQST